MTEQAKSIRVPLIIDGALLCILIFQAGIGWSRLETLTQDVAALRVQVQAAQSLQPSNVERLARIEEGVGYLRQDMANLREEIHDKRAQR